MLRPAVIALVLIILVILASTVYYRYLQHGVSQTISSVGIDQSTESRSVTSIGSKVWYDNVVVKVNYTVINNPEILSIAREFIRSQLPLPAGLDVKQTVDWLRTDIAVLKVVIELVNNGDEPVYYMTNAFCEVLFNATIHNNSFKPITWRVKNPITLPKVVAEEGYVFPLTVACTLDLGYSRVPPKTSIVNEYYYIVTKPFKGTIKAIATICSKPLSNQCRTIEGSTYVDIGNISKYP